MLKYFIKFIILKIQEIYQLEIAKLVFRHMHYNSLLTFSNIFKSISDTHFRSTRLSSNKFNLYLPRYKTNELQRSFKYQGVKIWNSILDHLRQNISFNSFKKELKNILSKVIKHFIYHDLHLENLYRCGKNPNLKQK